MLVNSYVTPADPRRGAKFRLHIDTYCDAGWQVGLLSIAQQCETSLHSGPLIEQEHYRDAWIVRDCTQARVLSRLRVPQHWSARLAARSYQRYVSNAGRPDIIHAHGLRWAGFTAHRIWRQAKVPYVLTEHMSNFLSPQADRPLRRQLSAILQDAQARLPVSDALGESLEQEFGDAARPWQAEPNMIDPLFFTPLRPAPQPFNFLTLGRLAPVKGYDVLLKAFAQKFHGTNTTLTIGGDGPLRGELEQLACTLGIDQQVVFTGWLRREEAVAALAACSAYVLSSHQETFGIPLLEAFASGKPVVATACGGPAALVDASNGILVTPGDAPALAEAMWTLFNTLDRYDSAAIQQQCRARYAPASVLDRFAAVYNTVLSRGT